MTITSLGSLAASSILPAGPTGLTGATGPQGPQGPIGATGPQGPQGNLGTLTAGAALIGNNTTGFVMDGYGCLSQSGTVTEAQIYNGQVPPGWFGYDAFRAVVDVGPSTTAINSSGFGFYVQSRVAGGGSKNGVGVFGTCVAVANGAQVWGMNPTLIDSLTGGITTTGTGKVLAGIEIDISCTSPHTIVGGIGFLGSSTSQPAGADCIMVGSLGGPAKWLHALVVGDGCANVGAVFGGTATVAANVSSIPIYFNIYDSGSTGHYVSIAGTPLGTKGCLSFSDTSLANGILMGMGGTGIAPFIAASGTDTNIDLYLYGQGVGNVRAESTFIASLTTNATSTTTGALQSSGGLGIVKDIWVGGNSFVNLKATISASTTAAAPLNIGQGTAPTTPFNGDIWMTSAGLYIHAGGTTYGPIT